MRISWISFTESGEELMRNAAGHFGGEAVRCGDPLPLKEWTAEHFHTRDALVFIGAAGIVVRAIAPHVESKATDPAVLVIDETGRHVIPILSGHLGGANELARRIASFLNAEAVITTATDLRDIFAADEWARVQGCLVGNPEAIRRISGALLNGERVLVWSEWEIGGALPHGIDLAVRADEADIIFAVHRPEYLLRQHARERPLLSELHAEKHSPLFIFPKILVLGVGMRQGISCETLESFFLDLIEESGIEKESICSVSTIDRKAGEGGLLSFCRAHSWPLRTFSAKELMALPGHFNGSSFVWQTVGADNVCERSAVLSSGGRLLVPKRAGGGITMAVAAAPFSPSWRWKNGCDEENSSTEFSGNIGHSRCKRLRTEQ